MKILCVIPSLPRDFDTQSIFSVLNQTIKPDMIVILPKKVQARGIGAKVSKVLNEGLSNINLKNYDYILRLDGDTILPSDFIERNIQGEPDLRGTGGYAMLIKISAFLEVMHGKFHPESDDSYMSAKFRMKHKTVNRFEVKPYPSKRKYHNPTYYLDRGETMYKIGYTPIQLFTSLRFDPLNLLAFVSYLFSFILRARKFDTSRFIWQAQVRRIVDFFRFAKNE